MRRSLFCLWLKLTLLVVMSSATAFTPLRAQAHETQPTIADITVIGDHVELLMLINLEAFLGGINLDEVQDTDEADNVQDYDVLRALPNDQIAARAPELLPAWNALPLISANGTPVILQSIEVMMPQGIDSELARIAEWTLRGALPEGADSLNVTWPTGGGAMVLRQQGVPEPFTGYLDGGQSSPEIFFERAAPQTAVQTFLGYVPLGVQTILPTGPEHILFVLGLFFLAAGLRALIWQVAAFTLASTGALAFGALGWVTLPVEIIAPLIAASIVYVAVENIFASHMTPWRPVIIFGFGLLHGLGFAAVLGASEVPMGQLFPALIGFIIGLELAQLAVLAITFVLVIWAIRQPWYRARIAVPASAVIAAVGAYWFVERVFL